MYPLSRLWDSFRSVHSRLEGSEYQCNEPQTRHAPIPPIRLDGLDSRFGSFNCVGKRAEQAPQGKVKTYSTSVVFRCGLRWRTVFPQYWMDRSHDIGWAVLVPRTPRQPGQLANETPQRHAVAASVSPFNEEWAPTSLPFPFRPRRGDALPAFAFMSVTVSNWPALAGCSIPL